MRFSAAIALLLAPAAPMEVMSEEEGVGHDFLKPYSHEAYHEVEAACREDVELLCTEESYKKANPSFYFSSSAAAVTPVMNNNEAGEEDRELFQSSSSSKNGISSSATAVKDPFADNSMAMMTTNDLNDLTKFMDQLFDFAIASSFSGIGGGGSYVSMSGSFGTGENDGISNIVFSNNDVGSSDNTLYYSSSPSFPSWMPAFSSSSPFLIYEERSSPIILMDYGVARLAADKSEDEIPLLTTQLQSYGSQILQSGAGRSSNKDCPYRRRMARRLTELEPSDVSFLVQLPFGSKKNTCLKHAVQRNVASSKCVASIRRLDQTFEEEEKHHAMWSKIFFNEGVLLLCLSVVLLLARWWRRSSRNNQDDEWEEHDHLLDDNGDARYVLLEDDSDDDMEMYDDDDYDDYDDDDDDEDDDDDDEEAKKYYSAISDEDMLKVLEQVEAAWAADKNSTSAGEEKEKKVILPSEKVVCGGEPLQIV